MLTDLILLPAILRFKSTREIQNLNIKVHLVMYYFVNNAFLFFLKQFDTIIIQKCYNVG